MWKIIGGFFGNDGLLSVSKVMSFLGYLTFLAVSVIVLYTEPSKFDYITFSILAAGSASGLRAMDKVMNIKSYIESSKKEQTNE